MRKFSDLITSITKSWLKSDNPHLKQAIEKTLEERLFSLEDIQHQLSVFRENVEKGQIEGWVQRSGLSPEKNAKGKKVLCLHAGNLPLVGFQTALAVLLSGADYYGKLSRKDPYLLTSFLEEVRKSNHPQKIEYSTNLADFKTVEADKVAFAGSSDSVPVVKDEIIKINAAKENADYIIRTAKFSIGFMEKPNEDVIEQVVEAALRYGGKGCRSLAMVVSPVPLKAVEKELRIKTASFWKKNPQKIKPKPNLHYQYAYNKAVGRPQIWLNDFLIQETEEFPETDFTLNWIVGDEENVKDLKIKYGEMVQSVYTADNNIKGLETEKMEIAQRPPLWWKPDSVDVLSRLINR